MYGMVRYSSVGAGSVRAPAGWTVSLSFAPLRLELSLDVSDGRLNSFSVEELHSVDGDAPIPDRTHKLYESIHDPSAQYAEFARIASVLRASGSRFFAGDAGLWVDLNAQQHRRWQETEDRRAIVESEAAFRAKSWVQVVSLLEPRSSRLSGAAAARLALAKKRLQSDP